MRCTSSPGTALQPPPPVPPSARCSSPPPPLPPPLGPAQNTRPSPTASAPGRAQAGARPRSPRAPAWAHVAPGLPLALSAQGGVLPGADTGGRWPRHGPSPVASVCGGASRERGAASHVLAAAPGRSSRAEPRATLEGSGGAGSGRGDSGGAGPRQSPGEASGPLRAGAGGLGFTVPRACSASRLPSQEVTGGPGKQAGRGRRG